jgi:hypothetical protein
LCAAAAASRLALEPWKARSAAEDGGRGGRQEAPPALPGVSALLRFPGVAYSLRPVQLPPPLGGDVPLEPGEPAEPEPRAGDAAAPRVAAEAAHGAKVNWAATAAAPGPRLFLADTSRQLAVYDVRLG